jgi:general secretion pathway protein D
VYVEALIVEVTADKAAEFGVQWQSLPDITRSGSQGFGGTNFQGTGTGANILEASVNPLTLGTGINVGVVRGQVTIPGVGTVTNLAMLARALETDASNILSTPNLLAGQREARSSLGRTPFITGQYAQTGSATDRDAVPDHRAARRRPDAAREAAGVRGGTVRLQIFQEASAVRDATPAGPITDKRAIESTVLIDDGQIIALGGLVQDDVRSGIEKVPILGDIPLLGLLFRYETRKHTKTNLMVFLRPVVLRDGVAHSEASAQRYRQMIGEQRGTKPPPNLILPEYPAPELPSLQDD